MYSLSFLNSAVHPTLHSCPIDISDSDASSLNMCAFVAFVGSSGISRLHVYVAFSVPLFGSSTSMLLLVVFTVCMGKVLWMQ